MTARLFQSTLCAVLLCGSGAASAALAAQSLGIKLQDASTDPAIAHMRIVIDHDALKPGRVTFEAENQSKTLVHEVLIARDVGAGNSRSTPRPTGSSRAAYTGWARYPILRPGKPASSA